MSTATAVKERPILFSGEMVRAILDGRKTQTRRIVKPQPVDFVFGASGTHPAFVPPHCIAGYNAIGVNRVNECIDYLRKPYARPGDRLWVRENFAPIPDARPLGYYSNPKWMDREFWYQADNDRPTWGGEKWKPSIHMPRAASRLTLEIKSVRVERLNDISEEDAESEGVEQRALDPWKRTAFCRLWETINGEGSWDVNPWVWVVEFVRID